MQIKEIARAKINLSLHVTGQREDGYHLLDSIVGFADFGDHLTFEKSDVTEFVVEGPFANGVPLDGANLVLQAAELMDCPAKIRLEKNLPPASGIGGGSADAAATLRGLAKLWDHTLPDKDAILSLGADVPVCMTSGFQRMRGIGEEIAPIELADMFIVLVNPNEPVSTAEIFRNLPRKENESIGPKHNSTELEWLLLQRNDLQSAAQTLQPKITECIASLEATAPQLVRMSGSGATCFAIYETQLKRDIAANSLADSNPGWWVQSGILGY